MNAKQAHDEAQKLRQHAEALRREALVHSRKIASFTHHQDYSDAKREEDRTQQLDNQASDLEQRAIDYDKQADGLQRRADELEHRKNELLKEAERLHHQIDELRGTRTVIGSLFP